MSDEEFSPKVTRDEMESFKISIEQEVDALEQQLAAMVPKDPEVDKLAAALAKAQGSFKPPVKRHMVDFSHNGQRTKYAYADLADVMDAVRKPLSDNELAVIHRIVRADKGTDLITELVHSSGQKVFTTYPLPDPNLTQPQKFGASLTYGKRYSLCSLIGLASEEDDDGENAEVPGKQPAVAAKNPPAKLAVAGEKAKVKNEAPADKAQIQRISGLLSDRNISNEVIGHYINKVYNVATAKLKHFQAHEILELLEDPKTTEATLMARTLQQ